MRRAHHFALPGLFATAQLLSAGGAGAIDVSQPRPGERLSWMPLDLVVEFDAAADDATLSIALNGSDVTGLFALGPPQGGVRTATASDVWGSFVLEGPNFLTASIELASLPEQTSRAFRLLGDPYADEVVSYAVGTQGGFNSGNLGIVLGAPHGDGLFQGGLDVVSLGLSTPEGGGRIVVAFRDNRIVDGPGDDFTVFENAFLEIGAGGITDPPFAEPGLVSVSQDGVSWHAFSACPIEDPLGPYWPGCAGVYPVLSDGTSVTPHASIPTTTPIEDLVGVPFLSLVPPGGTPPAGAGGDSFDLADVGLAWARYVKIESADFATGPVGSDNAGFDLDAVAAIHSAVPGLEVPALSTTGRVVAAVLLAALGLRGRGWKR